MTTRLLVSLSGLTAATLDRAADLSDELDARGVPLTLLLAPSTALSTSAGPVLGWVHERTAAGDALLQHGYDPPHGRPTAGLPAHEAGLRLIAASAAMERLGLEPDGFVPPRWLASPGTLVALRRRGFVLCADAVGVRDLRTGTVHPGRVRGVGRGGRTEPWRCRSLVLGAARTARRGGLVRLAADAAELTRSGPRQALLDAVDIALHHDARAVTYPALLTARSARRA